VARSRTVPLPIRLSVLAVMAVCGSIVASHDGLRAQAANVTRGCVGRFDAATDYFPDKALVEDAANFSVEYRKSYKVLTVKDPANGGRPERYVLVQCGAPVPKLTGELAGAQLVTVPVPSLFVFSPTYLSLLVDLNRVDVLTGVAQVDVVTNPEAQARIRAGKVIEFARIGLVVDVERVVVARPSLLMASGPSAATLSLIRSAGVPVVANVEWLESTALGRAEWLKYMALFLNEERAAQGLYAAMKGRYRSLSTRATELPQSQWPLVMTGRSTRGLFTIAGGRSYVAALIKDAGGRYASAGNPSVGIASVDIEAQIRQAASADIWINGGGWTTLGSMLEDEPRYAEFKAYRDAQVWVYDRPVASGRTNDYWSRSVAHPDLVLADLVRIFHPRLALDHPFEWYSAVPAR
jgi:iron complex transport system substrate-binding protein